MLDSWKQVKKCKKKEVYMSGNCKRNMYKTEFCHTYQETDNCPYGNKCRFAHGPKELQNSDSEKPSSYKTVRCRNFWEKGDCRYGKRCRFVHDEALGFNDKKKIKAMAHPKWRTKPCKTFTNTGRCPYGDGCGFIHINNQGSEDKQEKSLYQPQNGDQFYALPLTRRTSDDNYEKTSKFLPFFKK